MRASTDHPPIIVVSSKVKVVSSKVKVVSSKVKFLP
jgi:hypothetical protein